MNLVSHEQLIQFVNQKVITPVAEGSINGTAIDIHLGKMLMVERCSDPASADLKEVSLAADDSLTLTQWEFGRDGKEFKLYPGEFILAHTREIFNLPDNTGAEYQPKNDMVRIGLEQFNAGWHDLQWQGSPLTLRLKNMSRTHVIVLTEGVCIGQVVFFK